MFSFSVVLLAAWGVLALASVYPRTYVPLLVASVAVGIGGLARPNRTKQVDWVLLAATLFFVLAIALQLVPVPVSLLSDVSPSTHNLLLNDEVGYALRAAHPLSLRPAATQRGLCFAVGFGLLFLGLHAGLRAGDSARIAWSMAALGPVVTLIAIVQTAVSPDLMYGRWAPIEGNNAFGPFVNPNHFAAWTLLTLFLGFGAVATMAARSPLSSQVSLRRRIIWLSSAEGSKLALGAFGLLVMTIGLLFSTSRSALIGLAAGCMCVLSWIRRDNPRRSRAAMVFVLVLFLLVPLVWAGAQRVVANVAGTGGLNERARAWGDAIQVIRDFRLAGVGFNAYDAVARPYQSHDFDQFWQEVHNDYLELAADGGALLVLPAAILLVSFVRATRHALRDDSTSSTRWIRRGAVAGIAAIAVQEGFDFSLQIPAVAVLLVVAAGIAVTELQPAGER